MLRKNGACLAMALCAWLGASIFASEGAVWNWSVEETNTKEHPVTDLLLADCNGDGIDDLLVWVLERRGEGEGKLRCYALDGTNGKLLWACKETCVDGLLLSVRIGQWLVYAGTGAEECRVLDLRTGKRLKDADQNVTAFGRAPFGYLAAHEWDGAAEVVTVYPHLSAAYERIEKNGAVSLKIGDLNKESPCAFDGVHALLVRKESIELRDRKTGAIIWTKASDEAKGIVGAAVNFDAVIVRRKHPSCLEAYSTASGAQQWRTALSRETTDEGTFSGPVIGEGYVAQWMGEEKGVGFFSLKDGKMAAAIPSSERCFLSSINNGAILLKLQSDAAYAYQFGHGQPLWMRGVRYASVQPCGDALLLVDRMEGQVEKVETSSGKVLWHRDIKLYCGDQEYLLWPATFSPSSDGRYMVLFNHGSIEFLDARTGATIEKIEQRESLMGAWPDLLTNRVLSIDTDAGAKIHRKQFPGGAICCREFGGRCSLGAGAPELPMFENICMNKERVFVSSGREIVSVENPCAGAQRTLPKETDGIADFMNEMQQFLLIWSGGTCLQSGI